MNYIINADDFGRTPTVNQAIVEGFRNGALDRTTIMVNMPFFEEAVLLSEKYNFKSKVGLHINLTSGMPLTQGIRKCPRLCHENGVFNGKIFSDKHIQLFLNRSERKAVKEELRAQIDLFLKNGFTLLHADSHGHIHTFPLLCATVLKVLRKNNFVSVRISLNLKNNQKNFAIYKTVINSKLNRFNKPHHQQYAYFAPFREMKIFSLKIKNTTGQSEIMLHPNIFDGDIQIGQGLHYNDLLEWKFQNKEQL